MAPHHTPNIARAQASDQSSAGTSRVAALIELSRTLCSGTVNADRAPLLLEYIDSQVELQRGLDELLASPPVEGQPLSSAQATTAAVILTFWYAGALAGQAVSDRATAYYQLTAWQAMYTFPQGVCKAFGAWADAPQLTPVSAGS